MIPSTGNTPTQQTPLADIPTIGLYHLLEETRPCHVLGEEINDTDPWYCVCGFLTLGDSC